MNNNFSGSDFREEELFNKFLEKHNETKNLFYDYSLKNTDDNLKKKSNYDELKDLEELEELEEIISGDDFEINDFLPRPIDDKDKYLTKSSKIKYYFRFLSDKENSRRISGLIIPGFLILLFVINIIIPSSDISEKENRALAQFPKFSIQSLADGSFTKGFEDYISDQFIFRNMFVSVKRRFETLIGKKENHGILLSDDGYLIENSADLTYENLSSNTKAIEDLTKSGRYNVTFALVPTAYEIMQNKLPANSYTNAYDTVLAQVKNKIKSPSVKIADVKSVLHNSKDHQLYYRTDHHQTAHGSYWLYTALGTSLSFEPYSIEKFKIEEKSDDFWGTTWSNSGFAPSKADSIYKYTFEENYECTVDFPAEDKKMKSLYNEAMLKTKDKYAYYLDGNHGIAEIKSSCPSGKRIAIIKDSYAHSLVPFLTNHYSKIYMIDLRYFNGDVFEYLYNTDVKDILVLYNHNTFMTDNNLSKISAFAASSAYNNAPKVKYGVVPECEKVDDSYFDDAVFVGDSLTMGISYFSGFNSEFMCMAGLSTRNIDTDPLPNGKTVLESIKSMDHVGKVYIMLGTNEAIYQKPNEFIARYSAFIDNIRMYYPNAQIYIQSIMPMSQSRSITAGLKNHMITDHNKYLKTLSDDKKCYYVDLNSYFAGEDGFLPENAGSDGIHLSPDNYRKLADYLRTHAIDVVGIKKQDGNSKTFKGGKFDTASIGNSIVSKIKFKDKLSKVSDALAISNYNLNLDIVLSSSLYISGGSTAEEVAVFELDSVENTDKLIALIKKRVENRKKDFENYIPGEMAKLNNPVIVVKDNVVVLCIADSADKDTIAKCIK